MVDSVMNNVWTWNMQGVSVPKGGTPPPMVVEGMVSGKLGVTDTNNKVHYPKDNGPERTIALQEVGPLPTQTGHVNLLDVLQAEKWSSPPNCLQHGSERVSIDAYTFSYKGKRDWRALTYAFDDGGHRCNMAILTNRIVDGFHFIEAHSTTTNPWRGLMFFASGDTIFGNVHAVSSSNALAHVGALIENLVVGLKAYSTRFNRIVLAGDFNFDLSTHGNDAKMKTMLDGCVKNTSFDWYVDAPDFVTHGKSVLDYAIVFQRQAGQFKRPPPLYCDAKASDHQPVYYPQL